MLVWLSVSVSIWGRGVFRRVTGLSFGSIDNFGKLLMVLPLRLGGGGGSPSILASVPPVWRVHCSTAPTRSLSHGRAQVGIVFAQASRLVGVVREGVGFLQTLFAKACVQSKSALAKVSGVGVGLWAQAPLGWSAALSSLVNRSSDRRQSMRQRLDGGFFFPSLLARSQGSGPRFSGMGGSWGVQSSGSALGPLGVAGAASPAPL